MEVCEKEMEVDACHPLDWNRKVRGDFLYAGLSLKIDLPSGAKEKERKGDKKVI